MPGFIRKNAPMIAFSSGCYALLRKLQFPIDVSKLISLGIYGYNADLHDLEIVTPLLLTPFHLALFSRLGLNELTRKVLYAVSMGYIIFENIHSPHALPRNFQKWLEYNCGAKREMLEEFKEDCSAYEWIKKSTSNSYSTTEALKRSFQRLAVTLAKLQFLTVFVNISTKRSWIKVDVRRNVVAYLRTFAFVYSVMVMLGGGIDVYNNLVGHFVESEDIEHYRPSKLFQFSMFSVEAFIAIQIPTKSKQRVLTAVLLAQALMTRLNKHGQNVKACLPIICYLFSQF